jgi:hypothetical protein
VCRELLPGHEAVHDYLFAVNEELIKLKESSQMDILEVIYCIAIKVITYCAYTIQVVPSTVLEDEVEFTSYLRAFNDR